MKNIFIVIMLLILSFLISINSEGAEWKLFQFHPNSITSFANKTSNERIYAYYKKYIDTESIVITPKKEVRAWRKELFFDVNKDLCSQYTLIEVDCSERKYRYLKWHTTLHDENMMNAIIENPKIKAEEWDYLTTNQDDEILYKTWCSFLPKKK